jgi:hypothetical protein
MNTDRAARALGYTSLALGLTEIAAPNWLAGQMGIDEKPGLFRALGLREIASGVAILRGEKKAPGLWSRVAGDVMDLALLGVAARASSRKGGVGAAAAMVLGITALDVLSAVKTTSEQKQSQRPKDQPQWEVAA